MVGCVVWLWWLCCPYPSTAGQAVGLRGWMDVSDCSPCLNPQPTWEVAGAVGGLKWGSVGVTVMVASPDWLTDCSILAPLILLYPPHHGVRQLGPTNVVVSEVAQAGRRCRMQTHVPASGAWNPSQLSACLFAEGFFPGTITLSDGPNKCLGSPTHNQ